MTTMTTMTNQSPKRHAPADRRVMDLALFQRHDPTIDARLANGLGRLVGRFFAFKGVSIEVENEERLGGEPVILASNATHQYDPLPIRYALHVRGHAATTLSKGKNYHGVALRTACAKLGSIPLVSRGYIVATDLRALLGRSPTDGEYRAIRDHIDDAAPLPRGEVFDQVAGRPRTILGLPFDPSAMTYRECTHTLYRKMMSYTEALCRRAVSEGHSLHLYPQGSSATRLSEGHIGAVQLAQRLDLPVVPVGVSGCLDVFPRTGRMVITPGVIRLRIGEQIVPDLAALPSSFKAFHPEHERAHHDLLFRETHRLMEHINDLLDPQYRWAPDKESDGAAGINRFV